MPKRKTISFQKDSFTYRIYKHIVSKRAVTIQELREEFPSLLKNHFPKYLQTLVEKGMVITKKGVQSPRKKYGRITIYGVDEEALEQKAYEITSSVTDEDLLVGIKKLVFDILTDTKKGYTLSELLYEIRSHDKYKKYNNWDYLSTTLREMWQANLIARSLFQIPANEMINGKKPGFVYGIDQKVIGKKIIELMPSEIRAAFLKIARSNEIYPVDVLYDKFALSENVFKRWFVKRLLSVGWVSYYSYKQRRYYYNPQLPESYVAERAPKIHETEVEKAILDNSTLGVEFEKQAIFYFVMYLITKRGFQIRLNKDFPKKIPSWRNRRDIRNSDYVLLDKNGEPTGKFLVDVWKFDSEPFDYIIFTYDDHLQSPADCYVVSIKRDKNRKYLGIAGKKYIAMMWGCLNMGMSLDLHRLPKKTFRPVMIMHNCNGYKLFQWANKIGCEIFYKSRFEKMKNYLNNLGIHYEKDKVLEELKEEFELLERYKHHEDVILGKVTPQQLVRWENT